MGKRQRKTALPTESKADRFIRLGDKRVNATLKYLRLTANLAGPGYEYSKEQAASLIETLQGAMDNVKAAFEGKQQANSAFTLRAKK